MELRDYMRIARAHWIGITLSILLGLLVALGVSALQPRVYTADATGFVVAVSESGDASSAFATNSLAMSRVKSYVELGGLRSVAEHAAEQLGSSASPESLVQRVTVSNPVDTVIIRVRATGPTPEEARDLASAWVVGMQAEIEALETTAGGDTAAVQLVPGDSARLPSAPSSPNVRLNVMLGLLLGAALGAAYALVRHTLDRRVRNSSAVERETGLTVVGAIPDEKTFNDANRLIPLSGDGAGLGEQSSELHAIAEAMRELRTNIQYMDVDNPPRSLVVTSSLPGEGKSTTASNLAIALAASGEHVLLIDGDLRRPMIHTIFGLPGEVGISDVLAGRVQIADVAHPIGSQRNLLVVPAGRIPPNPSELLGSQRMRELVAQLAKQAFVIIDTPPLIPVTDASVLTHSTDGALLVTAVGKTTFDALHKAQSNLERAGGRALGVVLNRVPRKGAGSAYYGYQYTGEYYSTGDGAGAARLAPEDSAPALRPASSGEQVPSDSPRRTRRQ